MRRKAAIAALALAVLAGVAGAAVVARRGATDPRRAPESRDASPTSVDAPRTAMRAPVRTIVVGTGLEPASTQVSIEQDVALAARILPGPTVTLFAGGREHARVIEHVPTETPSLRSRLAAFFGAPVDPDATYRPTRLAPDAPATAAHVRDALARALRAGEGPLLVYWAGHGERGETPVDGAVRLWGGDAVAPADLAELLEEDGVRRTMQLVMTTCFSGAFAELVFEGADEASGPSSGVHCGVFAAPWDDEASGCDPDPDRARQEGFGLHFLNALRGRDRDGRPIARDAIDLDGDGAVGLLEALAHARIASGGIEVPTTTSERFLRYVAESLDAPETREGDTARATALRPEDALVAARLGDELGARTAAEAEDRIVAIDDATETLDARLAEAEAAADAAYFPLRIALLERWPALDDPWNPRFEADLARDAEAIEATLERSPAARAYAEAASRVDAIVDDLDALRARRARASRLLQTYENLELAGALERADPAVRARYDAIVACERAAPVPPDPR